MATSSAASTGLTVEANDPTIREHTPATTNSSTNASEESMNEMDVAPSPSTPTRHSFAGVAGQRPLPVEPLTPARNHNHPHDSESALQSGGSFREVKSQHDDQDVEMGEGDDVEEAADEDGSDNESVTSESQRPSKKKKGQRFFCTEFPPCALSFTRSEHLARHIRKHTGERPFQCHCSRRFSRLDNLRQHAQTVHVNEEIPTDSLAATSTRFQRQIRTDRVRPPNRSRANTMGSSGGHSRGHSRNLSTSSIGSTTSSVGVPDDRRRPQPLAMAGDAGARARLSIDTYNGMAGVPNQQTHYYNQSPTGYSTPTSTAFSTGTASPRYQSGMTSPVSTISRSSHYNGARAPGRRLSVPSGSQFQVQPSTYPPPYYGAMQSGAPGTLSHTSSVYGSPTSSVFSQGRRESESEYEYRRRTWHPTSSSQYTHRPATSHLSYYETPDEPRPAYTQQAVAASQMTRLPGIESFDYASSSGARQQQPSPMMVASSPGPSGSARPSDAGLNQGLTRLDITAANAPAEGHWQSQPSAPQPPQNAGPPQQFVHPHHISMPEQPVTPRKIKRNAWYGGPMAPTTTGAFLPQHRKSPEDSGSSDGVPTPSTTQGNEYHPVIVNPNGMMVEPFPPSGAVQSDEQKVYYASAAAQKQQQQQQKPDPIRADSGYQAFQPPPAPYALQPSHDARFAPQPEYENPNMSKLDALVAVATSEGSRAVEHRS